jgi:transcriptional regulator with PAS, ATPase and Fis domain
LESINRRFGTHFEELSEDALSCFMKYAWLGNVRELANVLEQACLKKWEGKQIGMNCIPPEITKLGSKKESRKSMNFKGTKQDAERKLILQALKETNNNKRQAAFLLGMPRSTLYKKIRDLHI